MSTLRILEELQPVHPGNPRRHPPKAHDLVLVAILALAMPGATANPALADDWPGFRGPHRDGQSAEPIRLRDWSSQEPRELFRRPLGAGYSGVAIASGRVFVATSEGGRQHGLALDAGDGGELWRVELGRNRNDREGSGPRATPFVDDVGAYFLGANAELWALEPETGNVLWSHDLREEFGARVPRWGVAASPLVAEGLVFVAVGGRKGRSFVAFERDTGAVRWSTGKDLPAYASPLLATIADVPQVVFFAASHVVGLDRRDGAELWRAPWTTENDVNAATPIFVPNNGIFISSGYDRGGALLQVVHEGSGFKAYQIWQNRVMRNHRSSSVRVGRHLFGYDENIFKCVDVVDGRELWRARLGTKGSLVAADGLLFALSGDGRLKLVEASGEEYRELGEMRVVHDRTWAPPALSEGVLYIRGFEQLVALEVSPKAGGPDSGSDDAGDSERDGGVSQ